MQVTTTISNQDLQMLLVEALKKDFSLLKDAVKMVFVENPDIAAKAAVDLSSYLATVPFNKEEIIRQSAIKEEDWKELQELWKDAPSAEELLMFDDKMMDSQ
jgi:hypothetical protein